MNPKTIIGEAKKQINKGSLGYIHYDLQMYEKQHFGYQISYEFCYSVMDDVLSNILQAMWVGVKNDS